VGFRHHPGPQPVVSLVGKLEAVHLPAQAAEVDAEINAVGQRATVPGNPGPVFRRHASLEDLQFNGNLVPLQQDAAVRPLGLDLRFVGLLLGSVQGTAGKASGHQYQRELLHQLHGLNPEFLG